MSESAMPPAPPGGRPGAEERRNVPSTVRVAVWLMWVRAALGVCQAIALFTGPSSLRKTLERTQPSHGTPIASGVITVVAVAFYVLFVLLAWHVRKGARWARTVTWLLSGFDVLGAILALATPHTALLRSLEGLESVFDVVLILLLAMKPSNDYFRNPRFRAIASVRPVRVQTASTQTAHERVITPKRRPRTRR